MHEDKLVMRLMVITDASKVLYSFFIVLFAFLMFDNLPPQI